MIFFYIFNNRIYYISYCSINVFDFYIVFSYRVILNYFAFSFSAYFIILLKTSRFSARSGVMYNAFILPVFFEFARRAKIGITEDSVLPEPVGATIKESIF